MDLNPPTNAYLPREIKERVLSHIEVLTRVHYRICDQVGGPDTQEDLDKLTHALQAFSQAVMAYLASPIDAQLDEYAPCLEELIFAEIAYKLLGQDLGSSGGHQCS